MATPASLPGLLFLARFVDVGLVVRAVLSAYDRFGYLFVFLGAWMEHSIILGVLIPGGTLVSLGGAAARLGTLRLPLSMAAGSLGMFAGAATDYWLGRSGLERLLLRSRFGPRVQPGLARAKTMLHRHGWWAITLLHVTGTGRSAVAVMAGACRFPFWRFMLFTLPPSILWSVFFNLVGYGVAMNLDLLRRVLERTGPEIALAAAVVVLAAWQGPRAWRHFAPSRFGRLAHQPVEAND